MTASSNRWSLGFALGVLLSVACQNAPGAEPVTGRLGATPQVGGQSGVEGSCESGPWRPIDRAAVREHAQGTHRTHLRWTPWWRSNTEAKETPLTIDVAAATGDPEVRAPADENICRIQLQQTIEVQLRSDHRAMDVAFPALLSASDRENALISTLFDELTLLPSELKSSLQQGLGESLGQLSLSIGITEEGPHGALVLQTRSGAACEIARIGSDCDPDEREVDAETAFGGFHASDALAALRDQAPRALRWRDGAGDTLSFDARLARHSLCVHRVGYREQTIFTGNEQLAWNEPPADFIEDGQVITIFAELRLTSGDGRLDTWVPVWIRTLASESHGWNGRMYYRGSLFARPADLAARGDTLRVGLPGGELTRVKLSGDNLSQAAEQGGLEIIAFPADPALPAAGRVIDGHALEPECLGSRGEVKDIASGYFVGVARSLP
ncbi:MAG TPA: hypothetical protein VJV78_33925 [Polyangiales bacterium]|nr:hypothetical protein [Polyangiales bacterium]